MPTRINRVAPMATSTSGLDYVQPYGRWVARMFDTAAYDGALVEVPFVAHEDGTVTLRARPAGQVWMETTSTILKNGITRVSVLEALKHAGELREDQIAPGVLGEQATIVPEINPADPQAVSQLVRLVQSLRRDVEELRKDARCRCDVDARAINARGLTIFVG